MRWSNMIDVVSTLSVSTSVRQQPQAGVSASTSGDADASHFDPANFVSSRIRVDNLQNVAILEYRSSRTGEVVRQYPTQSQIQAFKRAAQTVQADISQQDVSTETPDAAPAGQQSSAPQVQAPSADEGASTRSVTV